MLGQPATSRANSLPDIQNIKKNALNRSISYPLLEHLTQDVGPRLTGSPAAQAAIEWARGQMKRIGLKNVHVEHWQLPSGWRRGTALATLVSPFYLPLNVTSYGWTGSSSNHGEASDVIEVDSNRIPQEIDSNAAKWPGRILILEPVQPYRPMWSYSQLPSLITAATAAHAVAIIRRDLRPGMMLTHTEPVSMSQPFPIAGSIPVVDIAAEQEELIAALLNRKKSVRISLVIHNQTTTAAVDSGNVMGDLPGTEHPEQLVIIGAHLDSWDLGTGAIDDGFGDAAVLAAAEILLRSNAKPRRTIRFVLYTGEEQGLLGSRAYLLAHQQELANVICALALDWGQGPITKIPLAGHLEFRSALEQFAAAVADFQKLEITPGYLFATDAYSFTFAGLAGIAPFQESPNYSLQGHSAADTLDKVDPATLARDSGVLALMGFWIADYPVRLGESWSAAKTAETLQKDSQKAILDALGMWPFSR